MCNCSIRGTDVFEIKKLAIQSTEALYTGNIPFEEFTTEKGRVFVDILVKALKPMGINSMKELFDYIVEQLNSEGIKIDWKDFMPKRMFVQPLVGETDSCILYTESNDFEVFINSGKLVTKFTTTLVVRENGVWLLDSLVN